MLKRDFASTTRQIGSPDIMINQPHFLKPVDWGAVIDEYQQDVNEAEQKQNREALATALQAGDEDAIAQARAKVDPVAYASLLDEERKAEKEFQQKLALKKAGLELEKTYDITPQMKNIKYLMNEGLSFDEAKKLAFNIKDGESLSPYEKEQQKLEAKAKHEKELGQIQYENISRITEGALKRAEKALNSGTGLGLLGASSAWLGLSSKKGQQNFSDVKNANSQMNLLLRQALANAGVKSTELNAAVEAEAYRYRISPFDDENTALRKIENFKEDFLSGKKPVLNNQGQSGISLKNYQPSANVAGSLTPTMSFLQQGLLNTVPQSQQTSFVNSPKTQTIGRLKVTEVK